MSAKPRDTRSATGMASAATSKIAEAAALLNVINFNNHILNMLKISSLICDLYSYFKLLFAPAIDDDKRWTIAKPNSSTAPLQTSTVKKDLLDQKSS